jgi:F0F1-type ATP synthase membrane subunit b/b'
MLDQARREIESGLRVAQRELKALAAELAVAVATERLARTMTDRDQARLIDRYLAQVRH